VDLPALKHAVDEVPDVAEQMPKALIDPSDVAAPKPVIVTNEPAPSPHAYIVPDADKSKTKGIAAAPACTTNGTSPNAPPTQNTYAPAADIEGNADAIYICADRAPVKESRPLTEAAECV